MKLEEIVHKVYYINLDKSVERNTTFLGNWGNMSNKLERVSAVSPESFGYDQLQELARINRLRQQHNEALDSHILTVESKHNAFSMCCALSHAEALTRAIANAKLEFEKNKSRYVAIIAEDDAKLPDSVTSEVVNLIREGQIFDGFDILQMGYTAFTEHWMVSGDMFAKGYSIDLSTEYQIEGFAKYSNGIYGTLCYMVNITMQNIRQFELLVALLKQGVIADVLISTFKCLNKLIYKDKLAIPCDTETTIGDTDGYDVVELGYFKNCFELGFLDSEKIGNNHICAKRKVDCTVRTYFYAKTKDGVWLESMYVAHCRVKSSQELQDKIIAILSDAVILEQYSQAYIVKFHNYEKQNVGEKVWLKK
jgi:GR25 family glycosyltransferase involved in LPS biosynthesis